MLTLLSVDGFKSLRDFNISFNKGVNALIGPNGAGKSNICKSVELLTNIINGDLYNFIHTSGGIESFFTKIHGTDRNINELNISCEGVTSYKYKDYNYDIKYYYSAHITFFEDLKIANELLIIETLNKETKKYNKVISTSRVGHDISINILKNDPRLLGPTNTGNRKQVKFEFELSESDSMFKILSLLSLHCKSALDDITSICVWNINPNIAREQVDILDPRTMRADGKYLANAIFELENSNPPVLELINSHLKDLSDEYVSIESHTFNMINFRTFLLKDKFGYNQFANNLSDGTVKILALLVGLYDRDSTVSIIEEPENYLHPWLIESLIEILRDVYNDRSCIITTHSETILNLLDLEEILIVRNIEGSTIANNVEDIKKMKEIIQETGFGPGYYYVSGSIGGVQE